MKQSRGLLELDWRRESKSSWEEMGWGEGLGMMMEIFLGGRMRGLGLVEHLKGLSLAEPF